MESRLETWARGSTVKDRKCADAHRADKLPGVDRHGDLDSETEREVDTRTCDIVPHEVNSAPGLPGSKVSNPGDMGRTVSNAPGCAPEDEFDPSIDDFVTKERKYIHFDLPLTEEQRTNVALASSVILSHSFWPLLGFESIQRRVKRNELGVVSFEEKKREIKFGSHKDASLLEAYSKILSHEYEKFIASVPFKGCVLAYRTGVGDNVTQARDLFEEIREAKNCHAIALDIKGFFDHIDHSVLKRCLSQVLGSPNIPDDHFYIFRRITKYEWVDSGQVKERLGRRYARFGRICTAREFRDQIRDLVIINPHDFGIPQGTPVSGLFANIGMITFDAKMHKMVQAVGGSYRRYSDDIAIIVPEHCDPNLVLCEAIKALAEIGLEISPSKTEIAHFQEVSGTLSSSQPFQYLGFTFDGAKTLILNSP